MKKLQAYAVRAGWLAPFALLAPLAASADDISTVSNIGTFLESIKAILDVLLPILVTLALIVFFWGLVKFIWSADDQKARDSGKQLMIWGVIALFVMISVWGLVAVIQSLFGVEDDATIIVPGVEGGSGGGGGGGQTDPAPPAPAPPPNVGGTS